MSQVHSNAVNVVRLSSHDERPNACGFLWNDVMMLSMNCLGYANAQFMQPEPSKYAFSPSLEAKTFMQPEHPYFAHHPGRFFYIKNEDTQDIFSIPFAPCKTALDNYTFEVHADKLLWHIRHQGLVLCLSCRLLKGRPVERWALSIEKDKSSQQNTCDKWSIYAYFPLGYMSWMNQSASFDFEQQAIVATYVTPYQKLEDYPALKSTAQKTFLYAKQKHTSWTASQSAFEGNGGLANPTQITREELGQDDAVYEQPTAVLQHRVDLGVSKDIVLEYLFGAVHQNSDINSIAKTAFKDVSLDIYERPSFKVKTPDKEFDEFVNFWLPRQVSYHCEANRLTTDPQTRNYIQDNIGACFIKPELAKGCILRSLSQQHSNGEMPDGILLHPDAKLKYINQIPHSDHCVWMPLLLETYLNQTNDVDILDTVIAYQDTNTPESLIKHIEKSLEYLLTQRDARGLSYIAQGDWCDPMNMVGPKGRGVSVWLTMASSYAIKVWIRILNTYYGRLNSHYWETKHTSLNHVINEYCWDQNWYARGITDENEIFGVASDKEGKIFLNPQSWALLCGCPEQLQIKQILAAVTQNLQTPFGNMMLAPSYTKMDERIGRVTQKHIGSAENGSVYNHAFAFWIFALFEQQESNKGFLAIKEMLNGCADERSGQLPIYVPNYFRGAYLQAPEHTGRSSHLFNTGTAAWLYRIVIEQLFGIKGQGEDLHIQAQLPLCWDEAEVNYEFRGARLRLQFLRDTTTENTKFEVNGHDQATGIIKSPKANQEYLVKIRLSSTSANPKPNMIVISGVSGAGKSSIAELISTEDDYIFIEGDSLHSMQARKKMARGIPLGESDRAPWIARLAESSIQKLKHGYPVVLSYSGLKQTHRDALKAACQPHCNDYKLIYLDASSESIESRLARRKGHFFDKSLLSSQFDALEKPCQKEAIFIDAEQNFEQVFKDCKKALSLAVGLK